MPFACALCGSHSSTSVCPDCNRQFWHGRRHRCRQCAIPLPHQTSLNQCGSCLKNAPSFDETITAADYAPPIDQMVLALKFGGRLAFAPLFADKLHEAARKHAGSLPELLTAVPLGRKRLAERGFNQALEIARPLARKLTVPLDFRLAVRVRETAAQTLLPPEERSRNVRHAFEVPFSMAQRIQGRHIGIVDDVMTTGETLNELAAAFKRLGASRITNLVFARTLK